MPREQGSLPEQTRLEKLLNLEGGVFVKRSKASGGKIDGGWHLDAEGEAETGKMVVVVTKKEGNKEHVRNLSAEEVVRLNTGRNRGALEYMEKIKELAPLPKIWEAIDRADTDPEARKELSAFFAKEALKLAIGLQPPIHATDVDDLAKKLSKTGDHRLEVTDTSLQTLPLRQAELRQQIDEAKKVSNQTDEQRQALVEMIQDEEEVSLQLLGAQGNKRRFEADWHAQIKDILLLIDLTEQFKK